MTLDDSQAAHFCALQQDPFLQQGAEGAAGLLAAARRGRGASALGRSGGALALCASALPTRARRAEAAAAAAVVAASSFRPAGTSGRAGGGDGRRLAAGAAAARAREAEGGAREARVAGGVFGAAEVEVPAGGLPPAVGGEGGCPCLLLIPGRAHVHVTAGSRSPESISGAAGAASSSFVVPQVWGAGGEAAAAEADGGCLRPASGPGRARVHVTGGCQPPEYYSGAAAAAFLFLHDTGYGTGTKSCRDRLVR